MLRTPCITLAAGLALALPACGSGGGAGDGGISAEAARARIERAAKVRLAAEAVPGDAREQGLEASFSNTATAVEDGQVVALFVLADADVAGEVSDLVRASAPKSAKLLVNDTVMVVYASAGADRAAAVERAVEGL
jgi:hypothetical protein